MNKSSTNNLQNPFDFLYQAADDLLHKTQSFIVSDQVIDFIESVRWSEPFIQGILLAQLFLFLFSYFTRKHEVIQFGILVVLTVITLGAEKINEFGSRNWSKFATQDYFDSAGLFMMLFVSGPFVILANFIVIQMGMRLVRLYMVRLRLNARRTQGSETSRDARPSGSPTMRAGASQASSSQTEKKEN